MQVVDYGLSKEHAEALFSKNDYASHTLLVTGIAVLAKLLYAPFQYVVTNSFVTNAGYSFLFSPPTSSIHFSSVNLIATVNTLQLALEMLTILVVGLLIRQWFVNYGNVQLSPKAKQWSKLTKQEKAEAIELLSAAQKMEKEITSSMLERYDMSAKLKKFL